MYLQHQIPTFHPHSYNQKLTGIGEFFYEVKLLNFSCIDKYSHGLDTGEYEYEEERIIDCRMFIEEVCREIMCECIYE